MAESEGRSIGDFPIFLSGANRTVLEQVPSERTKFIGIGSAVLITSVLATASMWFAISSALGVTPFLALPIAVAWGIGILSLDRWLVTTMPAGGPRRLRLAMPRIAIALLMGFVVSTPLVLQIFRSEIDAQIVVIQQRQSDTFIEKQGSGASGKDVATWQARVAELQKTITANGDVPVDPSKDPRIIALTQQRDDAQKTSDKQYKEWQCQLYGGNGCTKKGQGPLASASENAYNKTRRLVNDFNKQIEARKKQLTSNDDKSKATRVQEAQDALPDAKSQLADSLKRQNDLQSTFDRENRSSGGLLLRMQALNEVSGKDFTLSAARFLLFLLFLLFECLPVIVKLMQSPGTYERVLELQSKNEFREARRRYNRNTQGQGTRRRQSQGGSDEWSVRDTWVRERPQPQRPADVESDPQVLTTPRAPQEQTWRESEESGHRDSLDQMALREMDDLRLSQSDTTSGPSGGADLFGDDEF